MKKTRLTGIFYVVFACAVFSHPAFARNRIMAFEGGACAKRKCTLSIDHAGNILAINEIGDEGSGTLSVTNPDRIYVRFPNFWGPHVRMGSIEERGTFYSVRGVVETIYWDNGSLWGRSLECGTGKGSVEDRIKDCSKLQGSSKIPNGVEWNLVTRKRVHSTGRFAEAWRDSKTGSVWGNRLESRRSHYLAVTLAPGGAVADERACNSVESKEAGFGIVDRKFGLPTIREFEQAAEDGAEFIPFLQSERFWSASIADCVRDGSGANCAMAFDLKGGAEPVYRDRDLSIVCVGRR